MSWIVRDRETGTGIDIFDTLEEAERALKEFEDDDMKEGVYTPDFYEIAEVEGMYIILDETRGHVVNESEAYAEAEEYGKFDDPVYWYGHADEAEEIVHRLAKETGHKFTIRSV